MRAKLPKDKKRVRIGPFIHPLGLSTLIRWSKEIGIPLGAVIDQLIDHAENTGFEPTTNTKR